MLHNCGLVSFEPGFPAVAGSLKEGPGEMLSGLWRPWLVLLKKIYVSGDLAAPSSWGGLGGKHKGIKPGGLKYERSPVQAEPPISDKDTKWHYV